MGSARSNLLNQLKGSFGNVILYKVNGQLRIRSKTGRYRKSKNSKQKAQKNRFKGAASFYHKLEMPMYMTWSDATHGQNISGYNLFIKENIHSFTETGEITEFSGLKICYGPLYIPDYFGMQYTTPDLIRLEWNPGYKNQGFDDDLLQIAIYDKTRVDDGEIYWLEGFETIRATGAYTFTLPAERGKEIHLFAFFKNKYRNIFSESRFLGTVAKET